MQIALSIIMDFSSSFKKTENTISSSSSENLQKNYQAIISTFPKENNWRISKSFSKYQQFWFNTTVLESVMLAQDHFHPQPNDIFICSCPKSGTTWLKALCFSVFTRTKLTYSDSLSTKMAHDLVPVIELNYFGVERDPEIPLLSSHIPYTSLPKSIINSNCKIIYVCRHPKDVLVSTWHFTEKQGDGGGIPWHEAYEKFCNGVSAYGPYWDHVLGYWKASLENPDRVLFLKYEDLKTDNSFYVKNIAEFMGCPISEEEEKQGIVNKIVEFCSFESMRNLKVNKSESLDSFASVMKIENQAFFRKGIVGDWKNHLTPEMAERIDQITHHKLSPYGLVL